MPLLKLLRFQVFQTRYGQTSCAQKRLFVGMKRGAVVVITSLFLALALPAGASVNGEHTGDIGRAQAVGIAKQRFGGKVLKVVPRKGHYAVKLLTAKGRVKVVKVDRTTGALLKRKPRIMAADAPIAPR